jgi:NitT/TauT family transport system substrate-binding protein
MATLSRPSALAATVALAAIVAWPGVAAAEKIRVGKSASGFTFVALDVGVDQRIFERHGLDIEIIHLGGSAKLHQAAVAGAIDIGLGAGTDVAFLVKGAPETAIGAISLSPALFGIIVPYDSPIHVPADLKGKRVGVSTVGSLTQWLVFQLAKKQGWSVDDITTIAVGSETTPQVAALTTHETDAVMSAAALGWNLERQKRGRLLLPASDIVGAFLMNVVFATNDFLKSDPDGARRFLAAWYETTALMARDKADTIRVAQAIENYPPEVMDKEYQTVMPSLSRDGKFPPEAVAKVQQSFTELKILDREPDMSKYLTEAYLPGAK